MGKIVLPHVTELPQVRNPVAVALPLANATEASPMHGASIGAEIQPSGKPCTWYVEYGPTSGYGSTTPRRSLPGKLSMHHVETFDGNVDGWRGGLAQTSLAYQAGGFVRYTTEGAPGDDDNHTSGIGMIHLPCFFYCGWFNSSLCQYLGGGLADVRGASMQLDIRGNSYQPNGSNLATWVQCNLDENLTYPPRIAASNWANTGNLMVAHTASGNWETMQWTLRNRMADWTYAGRNVSKDVYFYKELEHTLSALNQDIFPMQALYVGAPPRPPGTLDFDNFHMIYRNHNVLVDSNGGHLVVSPAGGTGAALLTDGYRNGAGHEWVSEASPSSPQDFEWILENPVTVFTVMIHNSVAFPSKTVEVLVSSNNGLTYTSLGTKTLPASSTNGPNFLFQRWSLTDDVRYGIFKKLHDHPINRVRVRITDAYSGTTWGLGAVEIYGTGSVEQTENDWYDVNQDIELAPGTWHYRVVATTEDGSTVGSDHTVVVT